MGKIVFTALRGLLAGHSEGQEITLDLDFQDAIRSRQVRKHVSRASGGFTEILYDGADTQWALVLGPFPNASVVAVKEFMDSTAQGENFRAWPYCEGSESPTLVLDLQRTNDSYVINRVVTGSTRDGDYHTVPFSGIEAIEWGT